MTEGGNEELEVEAIVGHIKVNSVTLYKVRWEGFAAEDDTYEALSHLEGCESLLEDYLHSLRVANSKLGSEAEGVQFKANEIAQESHPHAALFRFAVSRIKF
jgi:hypothetical protein